MEDRSMNQIQAKAIIEGLLFASGDEGVSIKQLAHILNISALSVTAYMEQLNKSYEKKDRGIIIMHSNDLYHLTTKPEHSDYYKKLLETPAVNRMSQAALETLAIIAYQQPITRVEIEEIRGVNSDRPVQTLIARLLIEEVGRKDTIGRPILFGTTTEFLTYFGLTSIDELPPLPDDISKEGIEQEADLFFERINHIENKKLTSS